MHAYLIATIDVADPDGYAAYRDGVPAYIARHGGRFIVRGGAAAVKEGTWPAGRVVIVEFPDLAAARAFLADPAYAPVAAIRHRTAASELIVAEGAPDTGPAVAGSAYLVANIHVTDAARYADYAPRATASFEVHKARYLVRGGAAATVEGTVPAGRIVIGEFADMAALERWRWSADYADAARLRQAAAQSNVLWVAGAVG